ncbi:ABC transporter permease, partial [Rhizobium hidalgonense]
HGQPGIAFEEAPDQDEGDDHKNANKAAAAKMGVTLPQSVLSRANKVIE